MNRRRVMEVAIPLDRTRTVSNDCVWVPNFLFQAWLDLQAEIPPTYRFGYGEDRETKQLYLLFYEGKAVARSVFFDYRHDRCYIRIEHPRFCVWEEGHECPAATLLLSIYEEGAVICFDPRTGKICSIGQPCKVEECQQRS